MSPAVRDRRVVPRRKPGRRPAARQKAARFVPPAPRSAPNSGPRTALQKHVDFFDADHDGRITLADTYQGLRRLGLGAVRSAAFAGVINAALGSSTSGGSEPHGGRRAHPRRQARERHRRLRQERALLPAQVPAALRAGTTPTATARSTARSWLGCSPGTRPTSLGHLGSRAEFGLLLDLAGEDRKGRRVLTRERLERFYNGSLFYQLAREVAAERESGGASLPGMIRTGIRTIY